MPRRRAGLLLALLVSFAVAAGCSATTQPTEQAAPANQVTLGVDVPNADPAGVERIATATGRSVKLTSLFVKLDTGLSSGTLQRIAAPGRTPLLTLEPWEHATAQRGDVDDPGFRLGVISSGRYDDRLRAIGQAIASFGRPVELRFAHEMNGSWYPWAVGYNGNTAADYIAAWRHVHTVVTTAAAPATVRWLWAPNAIDDVGAQADLMAVYPGDAWVDDVGMTAYCRDDGTPNDTFDATLAALEAITHRPVVIAETGVSGTHQDRWLAGLGPWLRAHPSVRTVVYFDTSPGTTGATADYRLQSPQLLSALGAAVTGS